MPFFSIIIPAYNRSRSIGRAVGSCLAQDMEAIEVIVVDDGSTDDTPHQVAKFMDPRVVYVRQENAGASAARNRGARVARGKYLAFLDSDDEFLPGKLSRFAAAIEAAGPEAEGIVWYSPLYFQRGEGNRLLKPDRPIGADERVGDYLFATDGLMQTSTLVIESRLFDQVRFDEKLRNLEDLDICLRLEAAGAHFRMLDRPLVIWHDDHHVGRLSYTTTAENVTSWIAERRHLLSERAQCGFLARYLAPIVLRRSPLVGTHLLASAVRRGSLSSSRAFSLLLRGAAPSAYASLRDILVARTKGAGGAAAPIGSSATERRLEELILTSEPSRRKSDGSRGGE